MAIILNCISEYRMRIRIELLFWNRMTAYNC